MIFNFFIRSTIKIGDLFLGYNIGKNIKKWARIKKMSSKKIDNLQQNNLKKILEYASEHVPFYQNLKISIGENPFENLKKFPITTKDTLRENTDLLISNQYKKNDLLASYSSGSSGVQSKIYMSKKEKSSNWGILLNIWMDQGYTFGDNLLQTGMSPNRGALKHVKDLLFRTNYINAFSHSEKNLKQALLKNVNKQNNVLIGYASSLNVIAEVVIKEKINLKVKSIISFGDKLFNFHKKNLEKAFNIKVKESYGSNEGLMISFQKDLDYMYILSPHVFLEVVDDNGNYVKHGQMGNLLVTRLDGFSMPLIRYKLGDLAILLPKDKYPKNRKYNYPLLQQIVGRESDVVVLKDDKRLTVHSFTGIFEYVSTIKQFRVIQKNKNGITIEYIQSNGFNPVFLDDITSELQKYIQDKTFEINFTEVEYIAPSKSGKPEIITSYLI